VSRWSAVCDAIMLDLTENVAGLTEATSPSLKKHLYVKWDPEFLTADKDRHLAVFPDSLQVVPLANEAHEHVSLMQIVVWENLQEAARMLRNEAAAAALFDIHDAIMVRLYLTANENVGASEQSWAVGTALPASIVGIGSHWFAITFQVIHYIGFV
jgi:hypothetical protein